jgi:hypothetical protein
MRRMKRGELLLSSAILAVASLAGCGGGGSTPDAVLVHEVDASPPDASPPDAFVCTMDVCPGDVCTDFQTDPDHCGDCDTVCQSGASCDAGDCVCIENFIPASLTTNIMDMIRTDLPGTFIAVKPFFAAEIDIFAVGYPDTGVDSGPYTLDGSTLPAAPFVIAAYNVDVNTFEPEAAFAAVDGTLVFTKACDVGASGTLTTSTFQAGTLIPPGIDPNGCTFEVTAVTFTIGTPEDCPDLPPPPPPA